MATQKSIEQVFRVHVLGVGNYFSRKHHTTSFVVQAGDRHILVEAPAELELKLCEYRRECVPIKGGVHSPSYGGDLALDNIDDIIITHAHGDHSAGLELIAWYKMYKQERPIMDRKRELLDRSRRPRLYCLSDVIDDLDEAFGPMMRSVGMSFDCFFDFRKLEEIDTEKIGDAQLSMMRSDHGGMTSASVMIEYAGRTLAYSGDTKFNRRLIGKLARSDVLIHECDGTTAIHTTSRQLLNWKAHADYKGRLFVCHFPDATVVRKEGLVPLEENRFIDI